MRLSGTPGKLEKGDCANWSSMWGELQRSWSDLGASWGAFGRVWEVLKHPLGDPGASWSDLGPSWRDLGGHLAAT